MSIEKFFSVMDRDGNGTVEASELRKGLESYNIFMNQNDWSNLFNLLDSDNSGEIDLNELKTLLDQERTGKLGELQKDDGGKEKPIDN
jgi:Ca2+-binding EF-hand superfamily protein